MSSAIRPVSNKIAEYARHGENFIFLHSTPKEIESETKIRKVYVTTRLIHASHNEEPTSS